MYAWRAGCGMFSCRCFKEWCERVRFGVGGVVYRVCFTAHMALVFLVFPQHSTFEREKWNPCDNGRTFVRSSELKRESW